MQATDADRFASNVAIVGAGLGGLTLAIALRNSGIDDVVLFEQDSETSVSESRVPVQVPVMLPPNATRVLRALGMRAQLDRIAYQPRSLQQRGGSSGFLMSELPLGDLAVNRFGAPYLVSEYHSLRASLLQQAKTLGVAIAFDRTCVGRRQQTAIFSDTSSHRARLLVGADGAGSVLRQTLQSDAQQFPDGGLQWSGSLPLEAIPESLRQLTLTLWLGNRGYVSHCALPAGDALYWRACLLHNTASTEPSLMDAFSGWQPQLVALMANTPAPRRQVLRQCEVPQHLHEEGFALLGDAAHPMSPHLEQEAALAFEDAWVLSRFIDQLEHDPSAACEQYQRFRLKRVQLMTQRASREGQRRSAGAGLPRALDRVKTSLTSRFLPELAMQRLDWMYRYDCIRGFE